ncbi:MAG: FadR/GntR family transcriptional regulator [Paracoccaceae bacterium]
MPFTKIQSEKLSSSVVQQIELLILRGILRAGDRLPAERDLSQQLGISRPSLRNAITDLSNRGLLVSRAGSGIFVAEHLGSAFSESLITLFSRHDEAVFDTIDFRTDMEGLAAERAARIASDTDLKIINSVFQKMQTAHDKVDPSDEARLDADFHMAIIEAGHNVIMLHMMRSMFQLLREGVFYNRQVIFRQKTTRRSMLNQHRAINDAIQNRNPDAARAAVQSHLQFVKQALVDERKLEKNEIIARMKFEREQNR